MCNCKKALKVKIKKLHKDAVIPTYAKDGDAGMDMSCVAVSWTDDYIEYETGIAMKIPEGYFGALFPRSSNSKKDLLLCNSVGVVDSGYVGPINFRYKVVNYKKQSDDFYKLYDIGDRVGQIIIMPYPQVKFEEVEELDSTERGSLGFGSSGD